jgi:hypothetical protein
MNERVEVHSRVAHSRQRRLHTTSIRSIRSISIAVVTVTTHGGVDGARRRRVVTSSHRNHHHASESIYTTGRDPSFRSITIHREDWCLMGGGAWRFRTREGWAGVCFVSDGMVAPLCMKHKTPGSVRHSCTDGARRVIDSPSTAVVRASATRPRAPPRTA